MAADSYAIVNLCAAGSFSDSVRHDLIHAPSASDALAEAAFTHGRITKELVDDRDRRSILFRDVRRLLWRGQRNLDARGDGLARDERHSSGKWHQEFPGHLHQQRGSVGFLDHPFSFMAARSLHGRRRFSRWVLRRAHCTESGSNVHPSINCGDWINHHGRDAMANEMKLRPQITVTTSKIKNKMKVSLCIAFSFSIQSV